MAKIDEFRQFLSVTFAKVVIFGKGNCSIFADCERLIGVLCENRRNIYWHKQYFSTKVLISQAVADEVGLP